jgi:uncharacterized protein (DUF2141 family)
MIRFVLVICFYLLTLIGFSQNKTQSYKLTVSATNAISDKGKVYFALYDSKEHFINKQAIARAEGILTDGVSTVSFKDVKPGVYAIVCFHDANNNGKMDFQDNGMPIEDYGMTNNIVSFGPPLFNDGKFEVSNKDLSFEIKF